MNLKILLPFQVFTDKTGVSRVVAETREGSFGLLPHRLDCAAPLAPAILTYQQEGQPEQYVAVDQGVLVKTGPNVLISVRHATAGTDLSKLHDLVEQQFLKLDENDRNARLATAKLETGLLRRFAGFQHE